MRNSEELVLFLLQRLLHLRQLRSITNGRFELRGIDAIGLKAVGERIGKVAGMED